jgi:hypothetical protein
MFFLAEPSQVYANQMAVVSTIDRMAHSAESRLSIRILAELGYGRFPLAFFHSAAFSGLPQT